MRAPCRFGCDTTSGYIATRNGQDCVYCTTCHRHQYNAPKDETGRGVRTLRTREDIPAAQRARILDRDNGTCIICHRGDAALDTGHLISVADGRTFDMTDDELYDDENLAAMCTTCNSGYGRRSVSPRLLLAALYARTTRDGEQA